MPVVSDFEVILDGQTNIGDNQTLFEKSFNTSGRDGAHRVFITMMVGGLTHAALQVEVKVNNVTVGTITPYRYPVEADRATVGGHWFAQHFVFAGNLLKDGVNEFQVQAIGFPESTPANKFDDFLLRDVICFFGQAA